MSITVGIGDVLTVLDEDGRVLISADIADVTPGNGSEVTITGNLRQPFRFRLAMAFRMVFGIGQVHPRWLLSGASPRQVCIMDYPNRTEKVTACRRRNRPRSPGPSSAS